MEQSFDFLKLLPNLRWHTIMMMKEDELMNLYHSSHEMERFFNTRDWYWRQRIEEKFVNDGFDNGFDPNVNNTIQSILNNKKTWFRVYFVLYQLNKLNSFKKYSLTEICNLDTLNLSNNKLSELPPEIGQLINLKYLGLENNQLTELPSEIGQLINLKYLGLYNNKLTELPPEIGQLINLRDLRLSNNKLSELPPEIGQLINLKYLGLENNNQLKELPPQIKLLTNLQNLYLKNNNQLIELPLEIKMLKNLTISR